jgi:hypothetical protein
MRSRPDPPQRQCRGACQASFAATEPRGVSGFGACRAAIVVGALTTALLAAAAPPEAAYLDGPPAAHTGGFGNETCHTCHFENDLDAPGGSLSLDGVPETFDPTATYRITVSLDRPGMGSAGFQLTVRVSEGTDAGDPAGTLQALDGDERVQMVAGPDGVTYAQHTEPGTALAGPQSTAWTFDWHAPADGTAVVSFHAAANAANDDASEFGDFIYTASATTRPAIP